MTIPGHEDCLQGMRRGVPQAFAFFNEHHVELRYPWHWQAFGDLSTERQIGMGTVGPIPYSKIDEYAINAGLTYQEAWVLHWSIRALDNHYLQQFAKRAEKNKSETP